MERKKVRTEKSITINQSQKTFMTIQKIVFHMAGKWCKLVIQVAEPVLKGNNNNKFASWTVRKHGQMERDTISLPPSARQRARRCIPAAPRADISSDQRRLSPLCLNQRETLERASEGAHSLTHSPLASARRATPFRRFSAQMA